MPVPTLARLVGGEWRPPEDGRTIDVADPADVRRVVARVPAMRAADVPGLYEAAVAGLSGWRRTPALERGGILRRAADLLRERAAGCSRSIPSRRPAHRPSTGSSTAGWKPRPWTGNQRLRTKPSRGRPGDAPGRPLSGGFQAGRSVTDGRGRDRSAGMSAVAPANAPAPAMTKVARGPVRATSGPAMR